MSELVPMGSKYTDDQRMQALLLYAIKGTGSAVSKETGIPQTTISGWRREEWWNEKLAEVRNEKQDLYIAKYGELIEEGTRIALEKLPEASARDAMIIAATANDKLRLALNQPTSISSTSSTMQALMDQFRELSSKWDEKQANVIATQDKQD